MIATEIVRRRVADASIDVVHTECNGHHSRPHLHPELALGVVAAGQHRLHCESGTHDVGPGDIVVLNPGEIRARESVNREPWSYSMFYLPDALVSGLGATTLRFRSAVIYDAPIARRLALLHRELRARSDCAASGQLSPVLRDFTARYGSSDVAPVRAGEARPHEQAKRFLEENWSRPIRLAELSRVAGVSVFYLVHAFKRAVGITPGAYLRQIRLARALGMLRSGQPVADVAKATVFSDQSHFTRRFKETLGYPPGAYRRAVISSAAGWAYRDPTR